MLSLNECRIEIDKIDNELMNLFERRMNIVTEVALYKKANNMEIFQKEREQIVIEKNTAKIDDEDLKEYAIEFLNDLMKVSKKYQMKKIGEN